MSRISLAAALLLGLAAAPIPASAWAQSATEDLAARTMQQNQRAFMPAPPRPQAAQDQAKPAPVAAAQPVPVARRFAQAELGRR
ncbi:hypothetical protein [Paracraurococcus ruber]|nr:hypothetical protein [Paracraurococcus ruber]TDG31124.1 hypothetical protein E2C05_12080 [Paracraurococcus ruber]